MTPTLAWQDHAVIVGYLAGMLILGAYLSRRQQSEEEEGYHCIESSYGAVQRVLSLPDDADEDGRIFYVAPFNNRTKNRTYTFALSDLVLEATDRETVVVVDLPAPQIGTSD